MTTTNSPRSPLMDRVKEAQAVDFWTGIYVLELLIFAVLLVVCGIYNGSFVCFITAGVYFFFICGISDWWQTSVERELLTAYNDAVRFNDKDLKWRLRDELRKP